MTPAPSPEITTRADFALLCNARGYKDAVEVGTDLGVFARQFMEKFRGHWLFCVDPYTPFLDHPHDRRGDLAVAVQAMAPYHGRVRFVMTESVTAARWIGENYHPDFVYVDGSHEADDVAADLAAWWAVLMPGGCLAGHDYDPAHPGVVAAVDRFAADHGLTVRLTVRLTHEADSPPSWYAYKGEPESLVKVGD